MDSFTSILTHQRKLQGATKELSLEQLEDAQTKLSNVISKRRAKEEELRAAEKEKQEKAEALMKQLEDHGLSVEDLAGFNRQAGEKKPQKKRPVKYILTDEQGKEHAWTGIGRMPKVFKAALDSGKQLDDFAV